MNATPATKQPTALEPLKGVLGHLGGGKFHANYATYEQ
jgi:hypothetical protein